MKTILIILSLLSSTIAFGACDSIDLSELENLTVKTSSFCDFDIKNMGEQKTDKLQKVVGVYNGMIAECSAACSSSGQNGGNDDASQCSRGRISAKPVSGRDGYSILGTEAIQN